MNVEISVLLRRKGDQVFNVPPEVSILAAVAEMNRHRVGAIVVLSGGAIAGIFTERDVLCRVLGRVDPRTTPVSAVMTREVITVSPDATVEEVAKIFTEKRCRLLPVVAEGRLTGLISIGDISRWIAANDRAEAERLKGYIAGELST
ncbi:MAG: CBS domain-containing protein [Opitutaceae bacterium]